VAARYLGIMLENREGKFCSHHTSCINNKREAETLNAFHCFRKYFPFYFILRMKL